MPTNVLAVDDSHSMRSIIASVVKKVGYNALVAESGEEALELFNQNKIDLAILDVELPGLNGFQVCQQMRKARQGDWFPVIYLSATSSDEYIVEGLDAGGDAYVSKPMNPRVLESIIKAMGRIGDMKEKLRRANRELEKLANYDGLTQILNRRGFEDALERYWRQAKRDESCLALMLVDADHFKLFNDNYGHLNGDDCLKEIALALEGNLFRPLDIAARFGGEEFAVLLPNTPIEGAHSVAERTVERIQQLNIPHEHSPTADCVTVSIGLALGTQANSVEELVKHADQALYLAKKKGRNRAVTWS